MLSTPYIENGKWKLFDKTYPEQSEADRIIFDGFFNTVKKHHEVIDREKNARSLRYRNSVQIRR